MEMPREQEVRVEEEDVEMITKDKLKNVVNETKERQVNHIIYWKRKGRGRKKRSGEGRHLLQQRGKGGRQRLIFRAELDTIAGDGLTLRR